MGRARTSRGARLVVYGNDGTMKKSRLSNIGIEKKQEAAREAMLRAHACKCNPFFFFFSVRLIMLTGEPMKRADGYDIDLSLPGYQAPEEPLPDPPFDDDNDDAWVDSQDYPNDSDSEEPVFIHYLTPHDSPQHPYRKRPNYKERLEREKSAWAGQLEELTSAFLCWKSNGPMLQDEGSTFSCRIISIDSELFLPALSEANQPLV